MTISGMKTDNKDVDATIKKLRESRNQYAEKLKFVEKSNYNLLYENMNMLKETRPEKYEEKVVEEVSEVEGENEEIAAE